MGVSALRRIQIQIDQWDETNNRDEMQDRSGSSGLTIGQRGPVVTDTSVRLCKVSI